MWLPYFTFHWRCLAADAPIEGFTCLSAVNRSSNSISGTLWRVFWFDFNLLRIWAIDASLHAIFKSAPVNPSLDSIKLLSWAMGHFFVIGSSSLIIFRRFSVFGRSINILRSKRRKNASSISLWKKNYDSLTLKIMWWSLLILTTVSLNLLTTKRFPYPSPSHQFEWEAHF